MSSSLQTEPATAPSSAARSNLSQPPADRHALSEALTASLNRRLDACATREPAVELGYGCVDWFIYGTDGRVSAVPLGG